MSPTVCPSLVFSLNTGTKYNSPWQELIKCSPIAEPCLFNSMHSSPQMNDGSLNLECRSETPLSSGSSSADRALSNDNIFSEFIQSPSPSCLSPVTVSHDDSLIVSTANSTTNCDSSSSDDDSTCYNLPKGDEMLGKKKGIHLHLRVGASKPKITLQFTKPITKDHSKRRSKPDRQ